MKNKSFRLMKINKEIPLQGKNRIIRHKRLKIYNKSPNIFLKLRII